MYNKLHIFFGILAMILFSSAAFASPGIPHQFYGTIYVNDVAAPDNTILVASVDDDTYSTITTSSYFGKDSSPIFYVPDPEGDRGDPNPETISFSVGGKAAGSETFENNGYTELNFELTTYCDDGFCLGVDETCSTCPEDCGDCPVEDTVITLVSPQNNVTYNSTSVPLEVYADQTIVIWMYSLNEETPVIFTPNTTINAETGVIEGLNNITVIAINDVFLSESIDVSFSVQIPETECNNGVLESGEDCDGSDFGGLTCSSYGYNAGSLSCSSECTIIQSNCYNSNSNTKDSKKTTTTTGGTIITTTTTDDETTNTTNETSVETEYVHYDCTVSWVCSDWNTCENSIQTRVCIDENNCGIDDDKPSETQSCLMYDEASSQATQSSGMSFPTGFALLASITEPSNMALIGSLLLLIILIFYIKKKMSVKNTSPKTYHKSKKTPAK